MVRIADSPAPIISCSLPFLFSLAHFTPYLFNPECQCAVWSCPHAHTCTSVPHSLRCTWYLHSGAPPADSPQSHPIGQALLQMTVWWLLSQAIPTPSLIHSHPQNTTHSEQPYHCLIHNIMFGVNVEHVACILSVRHVRVLSQESDTTTTKQPSAGIHEPCHRHRLNC